MNIQKKILEKILLLPKNIQNDIKLLKKPDVLEWIFGKLEYSIKNEIIGYKKKIIKIDTDLKTKRGKNIYKNKKIDDENKPIFKYNKNQLKELKKKKEDEWIKNNIYDIIPKFKNKKEKQVKSGLFGEEIMKEYLLINQVKFNKPKIINGFLPDLETNDKIYEIKTGTYFTSGTADEKIPATPYKYSKIPILYKKPLEIILIGMNNNDKFSLLNESNDEFKEEYKKLCKKYNITYIGFRELLNNL